MTDENKKPVIRLKKTSPDNVEVDRGTAKDIEEAPTRPKLQVEPEHESGPGEGTPVGQKIRLKTAGQEKNIFEFERRPVTQLVPENERNRINKNDTIRVVPGVDPGLNSSAAETTASSDGASPDRRDDTIRIIPGMDSNQNRVAPGIADYNESVDTDKMRVVKPSTPTIMLRADDDILKEGPAGNASMATVNLMGSVTPDDTAPSGKKQKTPATMSGVDLIIMLASCGILGYAVFLLFS